MGSEKSWKRIAGMVAMGLALAVSLAAAGLGDDNNGNGGGANAASPFSPTPDTGGLFGTSFEASSMQGSLLGTPGLWTSQFAETLGAGQMSGGSYVSRYSRNPGSMVFTDFDEGISLGLTRWLELDWATTSGRRVRVNSPLELAGGNYNPLDPFAVGALNKGPVDWDLGLTFGLLSQDRGAPFGLALQIMEHFPYFQDYTDLVYHGVTTGEAQFTENVLFDKWIGGNAGEVVGNVGYEHTNAADAGGRVLIPFRDDVLWSYGVVFPRQARLQIITELNGDVPVGAGPHVNFFGPTSPMDSTWGVRVNPVDWMGVNAAFRLADATPHTNDSGFVFGLSFGPPPAKPAPPPPPPPPPPPTAACNVAGGAVAPGATVTITSTVNPAGMTYSYTWTTTGGRLTPSNASATLDTSGLAPGLYTVTMHVSNSSGGSGECRASVEVREPPKNPPTASCAAAPDSTQPGGTITYTGTAQSPDQRPLTYAWTLSGGRQLTPANQATARFDTTGANPGTYNATLTVTDDRGLTASCNASARVVAPPPPPQAALGNTLNFKPNSARVDNAAKAALDDIALRLQQDPSARAVIVGYATSTENPAKGARPITAAATTKLAEQRAVNAKAYLVEEKGIAASRLEVRQDVLSPLKAEVWIVPQGATYGGPGETFDENAVKPAPMPKPAAKPAAKASGGGR